MFLQTGAGRWRNIRLIYIRSGLGCFFTFFIPFGCINYLPLMFILDKVQGSAVRYMLTPFAALLFFLPCLLVWQIGVRHYRSTGS